MDNQNANSGVRRGSGFTNLSRVLQANQQNRLGSAISSGLTGGSQNVRQQIGDTREDFKRQSEAGRLDTDANRQARIGALQQLQNTQDASQIKQIGEQNKDLFAKFRAGQYAGPQGLNQQNVQQIQREAGNLQQIGQSLGQQDKSAALSRFVNPQAEYSKGQRRLDSVLLGAKPVQQQLFQAKQQTRGLQQQVGQEQQNAEQLAKLRQNEATQFGKETSEQVGNVTRNVTRAIDTKVQDLQQQQSQKQAEIQSIINPDGSVNYAKYSQFLQNYQPSNENNLPITEQEIRSRTYNADPRMLLKAISPAIVNKNTVASQEEAAKLNALGLLGGSPQTYLTNENALNTVNANNLMNIDKNLIDSAISSEKQKYDSATSGMSGQIANYEAMLAQPIRGPVGNLSREAGNQIADQLQQYVNLREQQNALDRKYGQQPKYDNTELLQKINQYRNPASGPVGRGRL